MERSSRRSHRNGFLSSSVEVEAGIKAKRGTVIQEASARPLGDRQDIIRLLKRKVRKCDRQQIARFRRKFIDVIESIGVFWKNYRQFISLRPSEIDQLQSKQVVVREFEAESQLGMVY
jgi:hypothetical protein